MTTPPTAIVEKPKVRPRAVPSEEAPEARASSPASPIVLRLGVDFGTSTTQVAVTLPNQSPRLLRLEPATDHMPSYFAMDGDVTLVGAAARNFGVSEHSIKTQLGENAPMTNIPRMLPSEAAKAMLEEVTRRTIEQLRRQRLLPETVDRLEVATNLGCTSEWGLDQRLRLRDIASKAGLHVGLATMIEEPVAAAYEIMLSGLVTDGRVLVIDMGGGTLDVAVLRISGAGSHFELFATGGYPRGGDRFTEVIVDQLRAALTEHGVTDLTPADLSLIWERAEAAKVGLSNAPTVTVALGGIGDLRDQTITLSREQYEHDTRRLRQWVKDDVTNVYRMARLILDRGTQFDPAPGTVDLHEPIKGRITTLGQVGLLDDAQEHIDHVVLVGGGTQMPMIAALFEGIFGSRVLTPETGAIDRTAIVALGLAREKPDSMTSLRYPAWGISAMFDGPGGSSEVPLYEPYASAFRIRGGQTSEYRYQFEVPTEAKRIALAFRPVGHDRGERWPAVLIPDETKQLLLELDLFGRLSLTAGGAELSDGRAVPWRPAESEALAAWLPPWRKRDWWVDLPDWDLRNDK